MLTTTTSATDYAGPPRSSAPIWRDSLKLALLAVVSLAVGLTINRFRTPPLPLTYVLKEVRLQQSVNRLAVKHPPLADPLPSPAATTAAEPEMIDLARFHDLLDTPSTVVLDARPASFYRLGHVPGARSLARETFEADYPGQRAFLEAHRQGPLLVYCSGDACVDSRLVGTALLKLGYPHVLVFEGGWEEWQQAGLPAEK